MEEALESLFQARCPPSIGDGAPGGVYYEGYEDDSELIVILFVYLW